MNDLFFIALLTAILGGLPLIFVGYQIAINNKRHWINGADQSVMSNPEGFGKYVGYSILVTGLLILLVSSLLYAQVFGYLGFGVAIMIISLLPLPCFFKAKQKYS
ncbi:hypothetical protein L0668_02985 [Paraglaciecola aquimarina]|uniref:DUF3784 domain-containing protein n=1 Tax=Paraglaciecola algarum TaxID=3050085 RepID=A0ABS9D2B7_9ALTE|nr:hypothetical protein [Paraglaciecola sp. G1-23]MCF2947056.1 hypothetical protein [Paraglaciecola sp. G1-23]